MPKTKRIGGLDFSYNAPFILSFTLACVAAYVISVLTAGAALDMFFSVDPSMAAANPLSWLRLFFHAIGHVSIEHLFYNISVILLIGPIIEEKHGSLRLLLFAAITAGVTGLLTWLALPERVAGASGIGFMLIILGSFTNVRRGTIPLTFILVAVIYLGNEIVMVREQDNISQLAHIIGGICGGVFGFFFAKD